MRFIDKMLQFVLLQHILRALCLYKVSTCPVQWAFDVYFSKLFSSFTFISSFFTVLKAIKPVNSV